MEINNKYISTEAFQNFSSVCLQESNEFSFKETELSFNRNMIFRLKNDSSRQLFLITQSCT